MIGKVAKCQAGLVGLVLRIAKTPQNKLLYGGICLDPSRVGQAWRSINPEWIGTLDDWVRLRYIEIANTERVATAAVIAEYGSFRKNLT